MHTELKFGQTSKSETVEQLSAIKVNIYGAPSVAEFRKTISIFMMNTWNDKIQTEFKTEDIDECIKELFAGNILPTGMETIGLTFSIEGMNMVDTTHLIRHRLMSFSAQTHADRDMRNDDVLIPAGVLVNDEFKHRFDMLLDDAMALYVDMMDSGEVHCLDARLVMPRCFEHFYSARACIKDVVSFCRMRGDEQIQTAADNIIAMKLWLEVLKLYPFLSGIVNFEEPDWYYINQCKAHKTNIFPPNEKNNRFLADKDKFVHPRHRDEFPGGDAYLSLRAELLKEIKSYE